MGVIDRVNPNSQEGKTLNAARKPLSCLGKLLMGPR